MVNVVLLSKHSEATQKVVEHQSIITEIKTKKAKEIEALSREKVETVKSLKEERLKTEKLKGENKTLKVNLQAKKAAQAKLASATVQGQVNTPAPTAKVSGSKASWLAASGIPQSDWGYVDQIVSRESGWNPCAYNPGLSNCNLSSMDIRNQACGLAQSLPCGKQEKYGHWTDPVANLKWQHEYVNGRYYEGSPYVPRGMCANASRGYHCAIVFWNANHWY